MAALPLLRRWWPALLLIGLVFLTYGPTLGNGFVWDDDASVTGNAFLRQAPNPAVFWFTARMPDYWPLTTTVFWGEWRAWGLRPFGYHAVNLALHAGAVVLLWRTLRRLGLPGAYLAALLFAVHPVNVESVAWITQLKNLLALLFFLLAVYGFARSEEEGAAHRPRWYAFSLCSALLALLSKGSVAPLPFVLLGVIAWRRRPNRTDLARLAPYFVLSAGLACVDVWFQAKQALGAATPRPGGAVERLLEAAGVVWFYLGRALWPARLAFVYAPWRLEPDRLASWLPLAAALAATAGLWALARRRPGARAGLFAWGYFCLMVLPVMGFADVYFMRYSLVADHYQHLAIIGVVGAAGAGWTQWDRRARASVGLRFLPRLAAGGAVLVLAVLAWRECRLYRDEETLFRATLVRSPAAPMPRYNLALLLAKAGRTDEAVREFTALLRLDPADAEAQNDLGVLLVAEHRPEEALAHYRAALRADPAYAEAHNNLGTLLAASGQAGAAIMHYREALRLAPRYAAAHNNLGIALAGLPGHRPEAMAEFEAALQLEPANLGARHNLERLRAQRE